MKTYRQNNGTAAGGWLVLAWLSVATLAGAVDPIVEGERLQLADSLLSRGLYEMAVGEYEAYLKDFPGGPHADAAWFRLAESFRNLKRIEDAEKAYLHVETDFPKSEYRLKSVAQRAGIAMSREQYGVAVNLYGVVLKDNPASDLAAMCEYYRGQAFRAMGLRDKAIAALERVKREFPTSEFYPYALLSLGEMYAGAAIAGTNAVAATADLPMDAGKALEAYSGVVARAAGPRMTAEALFQTAEILFAQRDFGRSAKAYGDLLRKFPEDFRSKEAKLQAAWASHNAGLYAESLRVADEALGGNPAPERAAEWLYLKGVSERNLLKNAEAAATYQKLLQQFPATSYAATARYELALTWYKLGKYEQAVDVCRGMDFTGDVGKDVYWLMAESYAALEKPDEAIQYYRLIVRDFPDSDVACNATYRLAHHLQKQGAFTEAAQYYHLVGERYPANEMAPQALFAAGVCLQKAGDNAAAVRDWAELVRKYPSHAQVEAALHQQGLGEMRLGRDNDAAKSFRELLQRYPESRSRADALYWLGVLQKKDGKFQDAEKSLRDCLASQPDPDLMREAQFQLAVTLLALHLDAEAAGLFQGLVTSPQQDRFTPAQLQWLAEYRLSRGESPLALVAAQRLTEPSRGAAWIQTGWCLAGRAHVAAGNAVEAESAFRKALEQPATTPHAAESALRLGEIAIQAGRTAEAKPAFEKAAQLAVGDALLGVRARAYEGLARTAKAAGDPEAAVRLFLSVGLLFDDEEMVPRSLYEAAVLLKGLGRQEEARKTIQELGERYPVSEWTRKASTI